MTTTRSALLLAAAMIGIALLAIGVFRQIAETTLHDFAHHPEIVVPLRALDVELAILTFLEALG